MENQPKAPGLGQWVKNSRLGMRLSLRGFAEIAGIVHSTLDSVERGGSAREDTLKLIVSAIATHSTPPRNYDDVMREAKLASAGVEHSPLSEEDTTLLQSILSLNVEDKEHIRGLVERLARSSPESRSGAE